MTEDAQKFYENLNPALSRYYGDSLNLMDLLDEDRYEDETLLAEGASKSIYVVTDKYCERQVAMARIRAGAVNDRAVLDFVREVRITASLEHANIIRIYDVGVGEEGPFFTMELIKGDTLDVWLASDPEPTLFKKLEVFMQLCDAVSYAHDQDILHLDLKPENIHMGEHGRVILSDWGISHFIRKEKHMESGKPRASWLRGTAGFMAPEQADPGYRKAAATDVYGLGATLYYLLAGESLDAGEGIDAYLEKALDGKYESVFLDGVAPGLLAVLRKSLAVDPEKRYRSVDSLHRDVEKYVNCFATLAESASLATRVRLFVRRNRRMCAMAFAFFLLFAGVSVLYVWSLRESERVAVQQRDHAEQAQAAAETAQHQAEQAERVAREAFENYKKEEAAKLASMASHAGLSLAYSQLQIRRHLYLSALGHAEKACQQDPGNEEVVMNLGDVYTILFRYREAYETYQQISSEEAKAMAKTLKAYAQLNRMPSKDEMIGLFEQLERGSPVLVDHSFNLHSKKGRHAVHAQLIEYFLCKLNHKKNIHLKYNVKKKVLDVSGNGDLAEVMMAPSPGRIPAKQHYQAFCLFANLPIKTLIVDDTPKNREAYQRVARVCDCEIDYR